jgi:hypothetical protein
MSMLAVMGVTCILPACSDNPEGNPDRGSISVPRGKPAGGGEGGGNTGTAPNAVKDSKNANEGGDAARKISL